MKKALRTLVVVTAVAAYATVLASAQGKQAAANGTAVSEGKRLFEQETFGGNGRTCRTCHSAQTGTVSPADAERLFQTHPNDPLFVGDGSDDGNGGGTTRMRTDATIMKKMVMPGLFAAAVAALMGFQTTEVSAHGSRLWSIVIHFEYEDGFEFDYILRQGVPTAEIGAALADCGRSHSTGSVVRYHCYPVAE